jgi:hypothetical protein
MTSVSLKILMMYSDGSSARMGAHVTKNLKRKLGCDFRCAQSTWNAGLLRSPELLKLAAEDALHSDVVIIATSDSTELSDEVRSWIELWQDKREETPAALVALQCKPRVTQTKNSIRKSLEQTAARAHMDFFWHSEEEKDRPGEDPKRPSEIIYRNADPSKPFELRLVMREK